MSEKKGIRPDGARVLGALKAAHGRGDGIGGTLDTRGRVAILAALRRGVTDPDELRGIAREAKR